MFWPPWSTGFEKARVIPLSKLHIFEDIRREFEQIGVIPFILSGSLLGEFENS
jgi:hypothetical protein